MTNQTGLLRDIWQRYLSLNPLTGWILIFTFGIPRFILVLQANITGQYNLISVIFISMIILPFILLSGNGRKVIGLKIPSNGIWVLISFLAGILFCVMIFTLIQWLFEKSDNNCFVYISRSYAVSRTILSDSDKLVYFIIYSVIGMSFSPFGEEFFYRGVVHQCFDHKYGKSNASVIDSLAFAFTHLAHFGIVFIAGKWDFLLFPALLWVVSMFIVSRLFFYCKQKSGSLFGAVACHAGFNFAMMYLIFYYVL